MALTVKRIERLTQKGRYLDSRGLYLQVLSRNNRSWLLRWERDGRERWMGLGSLADFNLDEARERARRARQQIKDGRDPIEERRAERAARALEAAKRLSFEEATREYFRLHSKGWKNAKHRAQFTSTLATYVFPKFGRLPAHQ
jgi:hypothetical protein